MQIFTSLATDMAFCGTSLSLGTGGQCKRWMAFYRLENSPINLESAVQESQHTPIFPIITIEFGKSRCVLFKNMSMCQNSRL